MNNEQSAKKVLLNNRYLVVRALGKGGFGHTYLAEDTYMPSKRLCVVKQLKPSVKNKKLEKLILERFEKEAAILEKLGEECFQIPQLYAYFAESNQFLLVQEWIEGDTLRNWRKQQENISEEQVKAIIISLLNVLEYVHKKGIIHRDIKPDNIIIRKSDGKPVLIDFGAVKETVRGDFDEGNPANNHSSIIVGSLGYMPPEQAAGKPVYSSDLYALALVGIYLLTGKHPVEFDNDSVTGEITGYEQFTKISPRLAWIFKKALKLHPKDRFANAHQMLNALLSNNIKRNNLLKRGGISLGLILIVIGSVLGIKNNLFNQTAYKPCSTKYEQHKKVNDNLAIKCLAYIDNVPNGIFFHGGSTAWQPIRKLILGKLQTIFPEFKLSYKNPPANKAASSGTGIKMLIDGELSFAESSSTLKDEDLKEAKLRGFQLKQIPVAIDGIAVVVNPSLKLKGLTIEQLRDIYTGKITNWQQLGGENLTIKAYLPPINSGATTFFQSNILEDGKLDKNVNYIATTAEGVDKISKDGGIYLASAAKFIGQCQVKPLSISREKNEKYVSAYNLDNQTSGQCSEEFMTLNYEALINDEYPLTRRLFVIVKEEESLDQQAGIAYSNLLLTEEGQNLIKEAGFIPIRLF